MTTKHEYSPPTSDPHIPDIRNCGCATCRELRDLRAALQDAIELAEEGWAYDYGFFREKWDVDERLRVLKQALERPKDG